MFGGVAGYRPRVRTAYYMRVYTHSPEGHPRYKGRDLLCKGKALKTKGDPRLSGRVTLFAAASKDGAGEGLGLFLKQGQPLGGGTGVAGGDGGGDVTMARDDGVAGPCGEGDHVHQRLHRFDRTGELIGQHRIARPIDQRA